MKLIKPKAFDFHELVKQCPPEKPVEKDEVLIVLDNLIRELGKVDDPMLPVGMVPLNAEILKKRGVRNFPSIRDWLVKAGVLRYDHQYHVGIQSRLYGLTDGYLGTVELTNLTDDRLLRAQARFRNQLITWRYKHLQRWFKMLSFDYPEAMNHVHREFDTGIARLAREKHLSDVQRLKKTMALVSAYYSMVDSAIDFKQKFHRFLVDDHGQRLHTTLTATKKELRPFFSLDGQRLASLDLRSAQLLMLCRALQAGFWEEENPKGERLLFVDDLFPRLRSASSALLSIMLPEIHQTLATTDIQQFIKDVVQKDFYDHLREVMEDDPSVSRVPTREAVKKQVCIFLYESGDTRSSRNNHVHRTLRTLYPSLTKLLGLLDKLLGDKGVSKLLQRMESELMLNRICGGIYHLDRTIPLLTIHDCLITTESNVDTVAALMKKEARASLGYFTKLSIERWS